jgi:hypothetical protein
LYWLDFRHLSGVGVKPVMIRQTLLLILILGAMATARGQPVPAVGTAAATTQTNQNAVLLGLTTDAAKLSLQTELGMNQGRLDPDFSGGQRNAAFAVTALYKKWIVAMAFNQMLDQYGDTDLENTLVSYFGPTFKLSEAFRGNTQFRAILPTSRVNREQDSFQGAAGFRSSVFYKDLGALFVDLQRNVHEFETTALGEANVAYRARIGVNKFVNITPRFRIFVGGFYQAGRTYGNALRTFFNLTQELNYDLNAQHTVFVGHTNDGSALAANGVESDVRLTSQARSVFSVGLRSMF